MQFLRNKTDYFFRQSILSWADTPIAPRPYRIRPIDGHNEKER